MSAQSVNTNTKPTKKKSTLALIIGLILFICGFAVCLFRYFTTHSMDEPGVYVDGEKYTSIDFSLYNYKRLEKVKDANVTVIDNEHQKESWAGALLRGSDTGILVLMSGWGVCVKSSEYDKFMDFYRTEKYARAEIAKVQYPGDQPELTEVSNVQDIDGIMKKLQEADINDDEYLDMTYTDSDLVFHIGAFTKDAVAGDLKTVGLFDGKAYIGDIYWQADDGVGFSCKLVDDEAVTQALYDLAEQIR